jgi:acetolactate synthase I/II/III large subunit
VASGADILRSWCEAIGLTQAFVVPGADVAGIIAALRRSGSIRMTPATSEALAGAMAEGFVRRSGEPALVVACGGPGASALVPAVAQVAGSGCPILYVTGRGDGALDGLGWDVPDGPLLAAAGAISLSVMEVGELAVALRAAAAALASLRPVHLMVGVGVQASLTDFDVADAAVLPAAAREQLPPAGFAGRTLLAVGAAATGSAPKIEALARAADLPVVTDMSARGVLPEDDVLALGHLGFCPAPSALVALAVAGPLRAERVVGLAPSPRWEQALRTRVELLEVVPLAQLDTWLHAAAAMAVPSATRSAWVEAIGAIDTDPVPTSRGEPDPGLEAHGAIVAIASEELGPSVVQVADAGGFHRSVVVRTTARMPRTVVATDGLTAMGWSVGAAIGAALADPTTDVVAYLGDGSFHVAALGLAVAADAGLRVLFLVAHNGVHGAAPACRADLTDDPVPLPACDLVAVALACGVPSARCPDVAALRRGIRDFRSGQGPRLLVVPIGGSDPAVTHRPLGIPFLDGCDMADLGARPAGAVVGP